MNSNTDDVKHLKDRIAKLEARLDEKIAHDRKVMRLAGECNDLVAAQCDVMGRHIFDLFERMDDVELKLFPKLGRELRRIDDIVGKGEKKAYNPLDYRKNQKRPPRK